MEDRRSEQPQDPERGARGGEAAFAHPDYAAAGAPAAWAQTVIRWSPIWMGLLAALGIYFAITTLGFAVSLSTAEVGDAGTLAADILATSAIWNLIAALVALFIGGYLAGRLGMHAGLRTSGWTQGTAVWALYLIVAMVAAALGVSGLAGAGAGAMGGLTDIRAMTGDMQAGSTAIANVLQSAVIATWLLFAAMVLSWLAAVGGAWLGVRSFRDDEHPA